MAATPRSDPFLGAARPPGPHALAVKDNIDVAGVRTGNGLGRPGPLAAQDAPIVARLRAAGFVVAGTALMDEAALGATGDNPHHGRLDNPAAPGHSPGGSSGGPAVAAALGYAALGSDTLGSVRIPAAYCGVFGLKPTRGVLPMAGIAPLSPSLDEAGLLAADAGVLAAMLRVFLPEPLQAVPGRVLVPDALDGMAMAPDVRAGFEAGLAALQSRGWRVAKGRIDGWDPESTRRAGLLLIEAEGAVVHADLVRDEDTALSAPARALFRYGRDCGTGRLVRAIQVLRAAAAGFAAALVDGTLVATPTTLSPAFAWSAGPPPDQALLTAPANWPGLPAISIPVPSPGRPLSLQMIGAAGADWRLMQAAASLATARANP